MPLNTSLRHFTHHPKSEQANFKPNVTPDRPPHRPAQGGSRLGQVPSERVRWIPWSETEDVYLTRLGGCSTTRLWDRQGRGKIPLFRAYCSKLADNDEKNPDKDSSC